jgi:transcriptional regulator with XRE-family HTH domain
MGLYETIGARIKAAREEAGLSQETLAKELKVAANTISRWETATYKPRIEDLERLAHFLKRQLLDFFPAQEQQPSNKEQMLLRAASGLTDKDFKEVIQYAEFRKGRDRIRRSAANS